MANNVNILNSAEDIVFNDSMIVFETDCCCFEVADDSDYIVDYALQFIEGEIAKLDATADSIYLKHTNGEITDDELYKELAHTLLDFLHEVVPEK